MPRADAQAVRLSNDLLEALRPAAVASGRSLPMEIEFRLRQSLESGGDDRLSPWARVIGRHLAYLAAGAAEDSQSADEALASAKARTVSYFDQLLGAFAEVLGKTEIARIEHECREIHTEAGAAFAQRVLNAHEPDKRTAHGRDRWMEVAQATRAPSPEQLVKDQETLFVSPEALKKVSPNRATAKTQKARR